MNKSRQIWAFLLTLSSLLSFHSIALSQNETESKTCKQTGENLFECTVLVTDLKGQSRNYIYEIKRPKPGSPTILSIPGGPGIGELGQTDLSTRLLRVPEGFGFISIDPRGVGKNDYGPDNDGSKYTQAQIVNDLLAVIEKERPQNLIIYGFSHGSALATELAAKMSKEGSTLQKPSAVLLGGVISRALQKPEDYTANMNKELARIISGIPENQRSTLKARFQMLRSTVFKGNENRMVEWLQGLLMINGEFGGARVLQNTKAYIEAMANPEIPDQTILNLTAPRYRALASVLGRDNDPRPTGQMSAVIKCQELNLPDDEKLELDLDKMQIRTIRMNECPQMAGQPKHLFNAKEFQVKDVPIIYLQGAIDPATPPAWAKEHYNEQTHAEKIYVELEHVGHSGTQFIGYCQGLWQSIPNGVSAFKTTLEGCQSRLYFMKVRGFQTKPKTSPANAALRNSESGTQ
jgi:pimeloyl-ACP methyl ester carboxylesterase